MHRPTDPEDVCTRLLRRAQKGDTRAFAELYASLRPAVTGFVASVDGHLSAQDQEDIVQEVFLRAWRSLAGFRGEASGKTYILAIARHVVLNELRRRRTHPAVLTPDVEKSGEPGMSASSEGPGCSSAGELADLVEEAIGRLPDKQRQAVELDWLSGLPRRDASRQAGCSPQAFADRLYRARKRLWQVLRKWFHLALL